VAADRFWLFTLYDKDEAADLSALERKALSEMLARELDARSFPMKKRNLYAELKEGFDELADERVGKVTLRESTVEYQPALEMTAADVVRVRTKLNLSQPVFARRFRTEAKTIANWEQGRSRPNAQAAILLRLVDRHPELLDEIATL
jgi:putative transcriptional regulator